MPKLHNPNKRAYNRKHSLMYMRGEIKLDIPEGRNEDKRVGRNTYLMKIVGQK